MQRLVVSIVGALLLVAPQSSLGIAPSIETSQFSIDVIESEFVYFWTFHGCRLGIRFPFSHDRETLLTSYEPLSHELLNPLDIMRFIRIDPHAAELDKVIAELRSQAGKYGLDFLQMCVDFVQSFPYEKQVQEQYAVEVLLSLNPIDCSARTILLASLLLRTEYASIVEIVWIDEHHIMLGLALPDSSRCPSVVDAFGRRVRLVETTARFGLCSNVELREPPLLMIPVNLMILVRPDELQRWLCNTVGARDSTIGVGLK